ncbi:MAG: NADH:ubiquinone oxidoreductase subunit NDUFA12 [Rhodospirillales bacterium]|jgi:NADH:ubiquinone oxidoreductase subunit
MSLGTQVYTWLRGELIGTDEFGNRYYRSGKSPLWGRDRRWVMYKGLPEASMVPPEWHSWLHHTTASPLTESAIQVRSWQKEHVPNLSGTPDAYHPKGHILEGGKRARATGDYEPWTPE